MSSEKLKEWELLRSTCVQYPWFDLELRLYRLPDGKIGDYYIINKKESISVSVAVVTRHFKEVILAREFRPGPNRVLLEICGGHVNSGEDHAQVAARQALEQTGYEGRLVYLGSSWCDAHMTSKVHHYLCYDAKKMAKPMAHPGEHIEVVTVQWEDFVNHVLGGQLTSAETGLRAMYCKMTFDEDAT